MASRATGAEARTAPALRHAPSPRACRQSIALLAACLALIRPGAAAAQEIPDVVARDVLRVCADPHNMPFSNRKGQGFENRIAEIVADELKVPLRYYWLSQGPGFIANTLGSKLCDVVMGYAAGADPVQHTNPYYRSVYVLLVRRSAGLDGLDRLSDPRLQGKRLGVIAATPPVDHLLEEGLLATAKSYALLVDRSTETPAEDMIGDLIAGRIDGALLWGPIGGDLARRSAEPLTVIPLLHERERPPLSYRITFGIRHNEQDWKRRLNQAIRKRQADFDRVLFDFGGPLLDDDDRLIAAPRNAAK
ncbi:MAG: substrate-binding domain-containing protein [Microvirga sp.]